MQASTVGNLLLAWSRSFSNFGERGQALKFFGWSDAIVGLPCSWTGVKCNPAELIPNFTDSGLAGEGALIVQHSTKAQHSVTVEPHTTLG